MGRLKNIIQGLQTAIKDCDLAISDDILFENAIKIFISDRISLNKKENIESIKNKEFKEIFKIEKPTERQLAFLKKNNIKINEGLTKSEAGIMIDRLIKKQ